MQLYVNMCVYLSITYPLYIYYMFHLKPSKGQVFNSPSTYQNSYKDKQNSK